ncbi:MAG: MarR family transcriptional regulator [Candidatus Dactylopiibacterium sp.]|nr:MarR family transcriptional regulator [Candidatus Dactylopiibacterium sp.]
MSSGPRSFPPLEDSLGSLLARLKVRMSAALDEELSALDITHAQWVVLVRIADERARTSSELCKCVGYDTGSMTRMLDRLEEKRLIVRERSQQDRRVVTLRLSPEGEALYPQWRAAGARILERSCAGIAPEDVDRVLSLLRQMMANLNPPEDKS